jgi:hypothetical protein
MADIKEIQRLLLQHDSMEFEMKKNLLNISKRFFQTKIIKRLHYPMRMNGIMIKMYR